MSVGCPGSWLDSHVVGLPSGSEPSGGCTCVVARTLVQTVTDLCTQAPSAKGESGNGGRAMGASVACSKTCPPTSSVPPPRRQRWTGPGSPRDDIDEVVMGCIGQVGPDAYNARRVALAAGLPDKHPRLHRQPALRLRSAGGLVRGHADALGRPRLRPRRRRRVSMSRMPFYDFGARNRLQARRPQARRRHRRDADRPLPRHPHGRHRRERRPQVRRQPRSEQDEFAAANRSAAPPPRPRRPRSPRRSSPVEVGGRRPVTDRPSTSTPSPTPPLETLAALRAAVRAGRHRHRGQRLRHQRRRAPPSSWPRESAAARDAA